MEGRGGPARMRVHMSCQHMSTGMSPINRVISDTESFLYSSPRCPGDHRLTSCGSDTDTVSLVYILSIMISAFTVSYL